ncbi:MAG: PIG-L deacetylase family protein [Gemmatimonadaceae bacterium]
MLSPLGSPPRRIAALAAHADDLEIGCGGMLLKLARSVPDLVVDVLLLTGGPERVAEAEHAAELFLPDVEVTIRSTSLPDGRLPAYWNEVKGELEELASGRDHELVLCPRIDDAHQDHRLIAELVPTVWRDDLVLGYEIPKWDGDLGRSNAYVPLTEEEVRQKVLCLAKAYASQVARDWWDDEVFMGLARLRGMECRARYAEAFTVSKIALSWTAP